MTSIVRVCCLGPVLGPILARTVFPATPLPSTCTILLFSLSPFLFDASPLGISIIILVPYRGFLGVNPLFDTVRRCSGQICVAVGGALTIWEPLVAGPSGCNLVERSDPFSLLRLTCIGAVAGRGSVLLGTTVARLGGVHPQFSKMRTVLQTPSPCRTKQSLSMHLPSSLRGPRAHFALPTSSFPTHTRPAVVALPVAVC